MAQRTINSFIDEIYCKGPKQNYTIKKTDVYHIDNTRILDIIEMKDYGYESNRRQ